MVYKQSLKGKQILESKTAKLPIKIQNLLALVDGETTVEQMQVLMGEANIAVLLKSLVSLGLIEEVGGKQTPIKQTTFTQPQAAAKSNDDLARFRDFTPAAANQQELNAKFPPVAGNYAASDEADFKAKYGTSITNLVDSLRDSSDLAAFDLMFSLEKCSSMNQLKLLLPHVIKLANRTPQNEAKIKRVLELIN